MNRLTPISGLGDKAPACFLLETGGARLLLDFGEGPPPGRAPDLAAIGRVDAILFSHQHGDHIGSVRLRDRIGNPALYATDIVRASLPADAPVRSLPLQGEIEIAGVAVRTGRCGHAPGGVWLHFPAGDGFLYMGDNSVESSLYAWDQAPGAATVVLDASYGDHDQGIDRSIATLDDAARRGPLLLPAVPEGRGPEIALHLFRHGVTPALDDHTRRVLARLCTEHAACVRSDALDDLRRLLAAAPPPPTWPSGVTIAATAQAGGEAGKLVEAWRDELKLQILLTGYVAENTLAAELVKSGRAQTMRWNIHPRLSDNAALVRELGAQTVLPCFSDRKYADAWRNAFAPARTIVEDGPIEL